MFKRKCGVTAINTAIGKFKTIADELEKGLSHNESKRATHETAIDDHKQEISILNASSEVGERV